MVKPNQTTLQKCQKAVKDMRAALAEVDPSIEIRVPTPYMRAQGAMFSYPRNITVEQSELKTKARLLWVLRQEGPEHPAICSFHVDGGMTEWGKCPRYPVGAMLALGRRCEP